MDHRSRRHGVGIRPDKDREVRRSQPGRNHGSLAATTASISKCDHQIRWPARITSTPENTQIGSSRSLVGAQDRRPVVQLVFNNGQRNRLQRFRLEGPKAVCQAHNISRRERVVDRDAVKRHVDQTVQRYGVPQPLAYCSLEGSLDEVLLAVDTRQISPRVKLPAAVFVILKIARSNVAERLPTVQGDAAGLLDLKPRPFVSHRSVERNRNTVDHIDEVLELREVDLHIVIDLYPEVRRNRADQQLRATDTQRRIDLVPPARRTDRQPQITWKGQQTRLCLVRLDAQQHDRVGAHAAVTTLANGIIVLQPLHAVHTDEQDVLWRLFAFHRRLSGCENLPERDVLDLLDLLVEIDDTASGDETTKRKEQTKHEYEPLRPCSAQLHADRQGDHRGPDYLYRVLGVTLPGVTWWIDGQIVPAERALVAADDHGLVVGDGVFETMEVRNGEPFALRRHLERLVASARGLGLSLPLQEAELRSALAETIAASGHTEGRLRLTVTGGRGSLGSARAGTRGTIVIALQPSAVRRDTAVVRVMNWPRNERSPLAGLKTTSYAENVLSLATAAAAGADEAIFANTVGDLCEGTGSNIFVVIGGMVFTPATSSGCLAGVTRALVLETTSATEADISMASFYRATEAFLTSTTRHVQPIEMIDGHTLRSVNGPVTRAAAAAFATLRASTSDP